MSRDNGETYQYRPIFEPERDITVFDEGSGGPLKYCWSPDVKLVVNVALATRRALLLTGEPGVGKTVIASAVAKELGWRYYPYTVSSRTEAQDLTWKLDYVRRLADAQAQTRREEWEYLIPGQFWWAFDPQSAARRGGPPGSPALLPDPRPENEGRNPRGAVVLIDEIDKADPAVANDLLEAVGSGRFTVDGVSKHIAVEWSWDKPLDGKPESKANGGLLMIFTSNGERDLPEAFLRRCIVETMAWPESDDPVKQVPFDQNLRRIAQQNWSRLGTGEPSDPEGVQAEQLIDELTKAIWNQRREHIRLERRPPGLAEFLDAISACRDLQVRPGTSNWDSVSRLVWRKS